MTRKRTAEEKLHLLAGMLVEDVLSQSDEEILLELEENGTARAIEATAQKDLEAARRRLGKAKLLAAKNAVVADQNAPRHRRRLDAATARQRLASAVARQGAANQRFTLAARAGQDVPDEDLDGLIEDASDLGIPLDDEAED